ncbi:hypothetical protein ACNKHT_14540 [Shigella flexneri]
MTTSELTSSLKGKPVSAQLTVGVVDGMIYALQPEITRSRQIFVYPLGHNNVRTSSSLSFLARAGALQRAGCAWRNYAASSK